MTAITFAFIREGTSDDALLGHIRTIMARAGASEALGQSRGYSGTYASRIQQVLDEDVDVDIIFLHADSDKKTSTERRSELASAAAKFTVPPRIVPIVPVQELEAWALVDESSIRDVVGRPTGKAKLGIPARKHIENASDPKSILRQACLAASETTGRKRDKVKQRFNEHRRLRIDVDGPVAQLSSWKQMVLDISQAVAELNAETKSVEDSTDGSQESERAETVPEATRA